MPHRGLGHSGPASSTSQHSPSPSDAPSRQASGGQQPRRRHAPPRALPSSRRPWHRLVLLSRRQPAPAPGLGGGDGTRGPLGRVPAAAVTDGARLAPCPTLLRAGLPPPTPSPSPPTKESAPRSTARRPVATAAALPAWLDAAVRVWSCSLRRPRGSPCHTARPCCPPRPRQGPGD